MKKYNSAKEWDVGMKASGKIDKGVEKMQVNLEKALANQDDMNVILLP